VLDQLTRRIARAVIGDDKKPVLVRLVRKRLELIAQMRRAVLGAQ
jgi:hypothetical protein